MLRQSEMVIGSSSMSSTLPHQKSSRLLTAFWMTTESFILPKHRKQSKLILISEFLRLKTPLKDMEEEKSSLKLSRIDSSSSRSVTFPLKSFRKS